MLRGRCRETAARRFSTEEVEDSTGAHKKIPNQRIASLGEDVEQREARFALGWHINW